MILREPHVDLGFRRNIMLEFGSSLFGVGRLLVQVEHHEPG